MVKYLIYDDKGIAKMRRLRPLYYLVYDTAQITNGHPNLLLFNSKNSADGGMQNASNRKEKQ